ncbi:BQ5605_C010g06007 [Microbotryum silenes-dioicae]|uniref:BQ5605_C010g06007 protein n=1 Tax=Microbotryum silenes-dioicae TaxID=796604 RepID=A0A2X0LUP3_9BASI|nr:BQ5605_C010g06007 [Microbotryum silenes-dioicae]
MFLPQIPLKRPNPINEIHHLKHTQHCLDEEQVELSCIVDSTPAALDLSTKHGLKLFTSVTDMLAARAKGQVKVQGAILATPIATHVPLAKELVARGVHTLVEKPFCTDIQSGEELVAHAKEKNTTVLCGHHRRFAPYIVNLKRIIETGKLGQVIAIQGTWATKKPAEYFLGATSWRAAPGTGGVMMINLVHDLDLLIFLLGPITQVYCHLSPIPSDSEKHRDRV